MSHRSPNLAAAEQIGDEGVHARRESIAVRRHRLQVLAGLLFVKGFNVDARRNLLDLFFVAEKSRRLQKRHPLDLIVGL